MSGKKPLQERPVTEQATLLAYDRLVGDGTSEANLQIYQEYLRREVPVFWGGLIKAGGTAELMARTSDKPVAIRQREVSAGSIMYYASAHEQARLQGRYLPRVTSASLHSAITGTIAPTEEAMTELKNMEATFSEVLTADERAMFLDTGAENFLDEVREAYTEERELAFFTNPNYGKIQAFAKQAGNYAVYGFGLAVLDFYKKEPDYTSVMTEKIWKDLDPQTTLALVLGGAFARKMLWPNSKWSI